MQKILLVEDSADFQDLVVAVLGSLARVTIASSLAEARVLMARTRFDLYLIDVVLGDGSGFSLPKEILRHFDDPAIIFLTAKNQTADRITGYRLGAEDYIVKPVNLTEFKVRIETRLKKIEARSKSGQFISGNLRFDIPMQKVYSIKSNEDLGLTPLQFKLLYMLVSREGEPVSRDDLKKNIWGEVHMTRSIDTHITSLRKKLGKESAFLQSIYGTGYTFSRPTVH